MSWTKKQIEPLIPLELKSIYNAGNLLHYGQITPSYPPSGVYFVSHKKDVIYVGKSISCVCAAGTRGVRNRLAAECSTSRYGLIHEGKYPNKEFATLVWASCGSDEDISNVERLLIPFFFNPDKSHNIRNTLKRPTFLMNIINQIRDIGLLRRMQKITGGKFYKHLDDIIADCIEEDLTNRRKWKKYANAVQDLELLSMDPYDLRISYLSSTVDATAVINNRILQPNQLVTQ